MASIIQIDGSRFTVSAVNLDELCSSSGISFWSGNAVGVIRSLCQQRQRLRPVSCSYTSKVYWRYRKQVVEVITFVLSSIEAGLSSTARKINVVGRKTHQNLQICQSLPVYCEVHSLQLKVCNLWLGCLLAGVFIIVFCRQQVCQTIRGIFL